MKVSSNLTSKTILSFLIGIVVVMILISLFSNEKKVDNRYFNSIEEFRKGKDIYFKMDEKSPLENKGIFEGLNYFLPDPAYKVMASLELIIDTSLFQVIRSDGKKESFRKYAYASFLLNDSLHKVVLLTRTANRIDTNLRFLPFYDLTNGTDTYEGGRYLDIKYLNDKEIEIDFNLAYNPYCVYNYRYSCPIPPKENFINSEIKAGEKKYHLYE